ncbi:MAG: toxin-antitoxin system HicB family antitoxin [Chitinivibrionales bacterium]|nr:toxin-antitoxin system HicB family antitoxin [Chitinivibrionales bacterium]
MGAISLRLPNSIHSRVKNLAKYDGVSVNQFITVALTEKLSVMNAEEYFEEKAKRGSREKYDLILSKVSKRKPLEYDKK